MNKGVSAAVTGAAAAAAIGTAVYMITNNKHRSARKMKRGAAKTIHAVENIVSGISDMVR